MQLDSPLLSAASFPLAARPKRQSFSQTVIASDQGGSQAGVCQSDIFAARFVSQFAQQPHSPTCRQNCSGGPRLVVSVCARASFHVCVFASVSRARACARACACACACVTVCIAVCCVCACIYARVSVYCVCACSSDRVSVYSHCLCLCACACVSVYCTRASARARACTCYPSCS